MRIITSIKYSIREFIKKRPRLDLSLKIIRKSSHNVEDYLEFLNYEKDPLTVRFENNGSLNDDKIIYRIRLAPPWNRGVLLYAP